MKVISSDRHVARSQRAGESGGYASSWAFWGVLVFCHVIHRGVLCGNPLSTAEGQYGEILPRDTPVSEGRVSPGETGSW